MKISIIIPIYNSEKFLIRCVNSVIEQSYDDIEIILINDGSKDHSGVICDDFAEKDKRIKVIHQQNQGVSTARNNGINSSAGELLCFVDSDDSVSKYYIENLVDDFFKSPNTDLVFQGNTKLFNNGKTISTSFKDGIVSALNYERLFKEYEISLHGNPVSKLFKTSIVKENKVYFHKTLTYNEDKIFVLEYLKACKGNVVFSKTINYHYYINLGSLSNGLLQPDEYLKPYNYFKRLINEEFGVNYKSEKYSILYVNFSRYLHMYINSVFVFKKGKEKEYLKKMNDEDWAIYRHISKEKCSLSRRVFDLLLLNNLILPLRLLTPFLVTPFFTLREV